MTSIIGYLQAFFFTIYAFFSHVFTALLFLGRTRVNQDTTITDVEMGQITVTVVDTQTTQGQDAMIADADTLPSTNITIPRLDIILPGDIEIIPQCSLNEAFRRYGQPPIPIPTPTPTPTTSTPGFITSKYSSTDSSLDHTTTSGGESSTTSSSATSMSSHWRNHHDLDKEVNIIGMVDNSQIVENVDFDSPTIAAEGPITPLIYEIPTSHEQNQQTEDIEIEVDISTQPLPIDWVSIIQYIDKFEHGVSYGHSRHLFKHALTQVDGSNTNTNTSTTSTLLISAFNVDVDDDYVSDYDESEGFDEDYV